MKQVLVCLIFFAGLSVCTKGFAQIFIKAVGNTGMPGGVGTFDGGSTAEGHANEIEASAYSDGLAGCSNIGPGGGGCKVSKSPFTFSMPLSFAVNSFKNNLIAGRLITTVDMVLRKNDGEGPHGGFEYYKVHMEGVSVSSITEGARSPGSPEFNIELLPQKIAWQILKQNSDGGQSPASKFSIGWDFPKNKSFSYTFPAGGGGIGVTD